MCAMLPRRLLPWLFVLTLLFGQTAAFAHALSHLSTHESAAPDQVCEVCIAQAQLGSPTPPATHTLSLPAHSSTLACVSEPHRVTLAPRAACARAPPAPSPA